MLTLAEAREQVKTNCQASLDPPLTDAEVEAILTATVRGVVWAGTTALAYGASVVPTARNGHRYQVTTAGTTGGSEPGWGTDRATAVTSGTVTLHEAGPDWAELYDLRRATWEAYRLKLAKAQNYLTVGGDGQTVNLQQIVQNLREAARAWQPAVLV